MPSQTVLWIREKGHCLQITELLPPVAGYAMENGITPTCPAVIFLRERSSERGMRSGFERSADSEETLFGITHSIPDAT
jgi:hypothetical protein